MFKKIVLLVIALITIGGVATSTPAIPAAAATHHVIKWHGKQYKSKYTIKQMRKKFHLKYYKSKDSARVTWTHNKFLGIVKGANVHTGAAGETHAAGSVTHKGRYALFFTGQTSQGGGNAYGSEYINLKTGKHYHDQA